MTDEPHETKGDSRPKILSGVTGVVGGLTALVVAVAGLLTAYRGLGPSEKPARAERQVGAAADVPRPQTEAEAEARPICRPVTPAPGRAMLSRWHGRTGCGSRPPTRATNPPSCSNMSSSRVLTG